MNTSCPASDMHSAGHAPQIDVSRGTHAIPFMRVMSYMEAKQWAIREKLHHYGIFRPELLKEDDNNGEFDNQG
jgi:hypothetical protein